MKLNIIFQISRTASLDEIQAEIEKYFGKKMRLIKEEHSIFEQWQVRPADQVFVQKVWTYRLICRSGVYYFGTIQ
jgi:hypothetical protein